MDKLTTRTYRYLYPKELEFKLQEHYSPSELGKLLKVSAKTIKRLSHKHQLRVHFVGRQMRIPKTEAIKLIEAGYALYNDQ